MDIEEFKLLGNFFGCYFNQDFYCIYGSSEGAISSFLNEAGKKTIEETADEISYLLNLDLPEEDLRLFIRKLDSNYAPWFGEEDSFSTSGWLFELANEFCEYAYS